MMCNDESKSFKLCPFAVGLALGVTVAIAVIVCSAWAMYMGGDADAMKGLIQATWPAAIMYALYMLIKFFIVGFVFGLIYNYVICRKKKACCKPEKAE